MVGIIKEINGQKKIVPLTTDTGTGAPVGTLVTQYKKVPMSGYLYCDGSTFDENNYPALYMYLGTNVLPDYRECVMVGAEQNTTDTIATHDVYGKGEFKDDQLQEHEHNIYINGTRLPQLPNSTAGIGNQLRVLNNNGSGNDVIIKDIVNARPGETTHGKQKAVYVYIKATSGLAENQQENVLNDVKEYVDGKALYRKVTKDLSTGWNYLIKFEGLKAGTYVITTTIDVIVNNINAVVDDKFTQIGVDGTKNGTLILDIANDGTDMTIAVYTNVVTSGVTLHIVLMKVS